MRALIFSLALLGGCAASKKDRTVLFTENGLRSAEAVWDTAYHTKLEYCQSRHEPKTEGAEKCFGPWYDADAQVSAVVKKAAELLRLYWEARARGEEPSWLDVVQQVAAMVASLPPDARAFFERVQGAE